jgi:hypothetical protein
MTFNAFGFLFFSITVGLYFVLSVDTSSVTSPRASNTVWAWIHTGMPSLIQPRLFDCPCNPLARQTSHSGDA